MPPAEDSVNPYTLLLGKPAASVTSLRGFEQYVAPQQKATIDHYKPLPPPPAMMRRLSNDESRERPFALSDSRSSSVYSRAWQTSKAADNYDYPMPVNREDFYKANRSHVRASMSEPQLLLPRTYRPLLPSPSSPTNDTPSSFVPTSMAQRPSQLLPEPVLSPPLPKEQLHTISLVKAQALVDAPGSQHLLPEELRARRLGKSRPTEVMDSLTDATTTKPPRPGSTYKPFGSPSSRLPSVMMFDAQTWHTYDPSKKNLEQAALAMPSASRSGSGDRGRTMQRVPRKPAPKSAPKTANRLAAEYGSLLSGPARQCSTSPPQSPAVTGLGIQCTLDRSASHGKVVPDPLFSTSGGSSNAWTVQKQYQDSLNSSVSPGCTCRSPRMAQSPAPSNMTVDSQPESTPPPKYLFDCSADSTRDDDAEDEHDSRMGSIPISPPSPTFPPSNNFRKLKSENLQPPPMPPSPTIPSLPPPAVVAALAAAKKAQELQDCKTRKKRRESAYYPYVGPRRLDKSRTSKPHPISTQRAIHRADPIQPESSTHRGKGSEVGELMSRAVLKATSMGHHLKDKFVREPEQGHGYTISRPILPDSPHLHPTQTSPATLGQSVTAVYLGWSEESKEDFDASKPVSPRHHRAANSWLPNTTIRPTYEHTVTPARPLDERTHHDDAPPRGSLSRSSSIFGDWFDLRRERDRERRRDDIKKTIRVLPNAYDASTMGEARRPSLAEKSASDVGPHAADSAAAAAAEPQPRLSIWGRRISEFGMI